MKKITIVIILILGTIFIFGCNSGGTGQVTNTPQCHNVQVPYETQQTYTETVPYTATECTNQPIIYKKEVGQCTQSSTGFLGMNPQPASYSCIITNLDTQPATFKVTIGFNIDNQNHIEEVQTKYIYPQSSQTYTYQKDATIQNCYCNEEIPQKQVCKDVIKYQDIQKTREITEYKTEQQCQ